VLGAGKREVRDNLQQFITCPVGYFVPAKSAIVFFASRVQPHCNKAPAPVNMPAELGLPSVAVPFSVPSPKNASGNRLVFDPTTPSISVFCEKSPI
jgi:hypothetical protein